MLARRKRPILSLSGLVLIGWLLCGVEAEAQDPARWDDSMRAFAAEDAATSPPTNAIVFTGSSTITLWKTVREDMAPLTVINRGFGGSTMQDVVYWLHALVLRHKPQAVVLYEGDNDIAYYGSTPEEVLEDFRTLVSRLHAELPEARIYFLAIKPSVLRWGAWPEMRRANDLIRAFCETRPKLHFIDVASPMLDGQGQPRADIFEADNLHLNARGYELWASVVRPILLEHERVHESGHKSSWRIAVETRTDDKAMRPSRLFVDTFVARRSAAQFLSLQQDGV